MMGWKSTLVAGGPVRRRGLLLLLLEVGRLLLLLLLLLWRGLTRREALRLVSWKRLVRGLVVGRWGRTPTPASIVLP